MHSFIAVRLAFMGAVVYAATHIQPFPIHVAVNRMVGLFVALIIIVLPYMLQTTAGRMIFGRHLEGSTTATLMDPDELAKRSRPAAEA